MASPAGVPAFDHLLSGMGTTETNPLVLGLFLTGMSILPLALLCLSSFIKLSVVFSILRSAIGAGQFPSGAVTSLLSVVLTLHIMAPVAHQTLATMTTAAPSPAPSQIKESRLAGMVKGLERASVPLLQFLRKNCRHEERQFFAELAKRQPGSMQDAGRPPDEHVSIPVCDTDTACTISGETFFTLVPAFVLSELREAFAIGFTLFLPFLVIEIVTANVLTALGMTMMSPVTIALPFKILLFVVCDGWFLLCRALVLGYT